jgi:hypothetical protein
MALDASWRATRLGMSADEAWPDRFESIGLQRPTSWIEREGRSRTWWEPSTWASAGTERVLIDLDDLDHACLEDLSALPHILAEARNRAARDPRVAHLDMLVTSPTGIHVRLYLTRYERDERSFYADESVRAWLQEWGAWLLSRLGRGGRVDPARWSPGGYLRKPGWRLLPDLQPFLVHLVDPPVEQIVSYQESEA